MTVIDAAIQGVPEQAKRRLRTVTNHFSVRRKSPGLTRHESQQNGGRSLSPPASLEVRGLDLVTSYASSEGDSATGCVKTE